MKIYPLPDLAWELVPRLREVLETGQWKARRVRPAVDLWVICIITHRAHLGVLLINKILSKVQVQVDIEINISEHRP